MAPSTRDTGWFKSSHSAAAEENCVEIRLTRSAVGIRDTKNRSGGALALPPVSWRTLIDGTKCGGFALPL
ncbi:DUF397 domain-containing protein [Actinokineospora auranticolor]|uniref:DUF397 domain-containing protein n=1 Tax=Actinokineospora auranticolor TaxID=155976 RepID=UPI000CECDB82|nr:DUF397 domain-containing protein [Actinokineospora auranticolor]